MTSNDDYLSARIKALHGGKPPKDVTERGKKAFEQMIQSRRQDRQKRRLETAEQISKLRAPFIKKLSAEPDCAAAIAEFQERQKKAAKELQERPRKIGPLSNRHRPQMPIKPDIKSSPLITVLPPI